MIDEEKIINFILKVGGDFDKEAKNQDITLEESLHVIKGLLNILCEKMVKVCNSQEKLDNQEKHIKIVLNDSFQPCFNKRRHQLMKQGLYPLATYSKNDLLDQIGNILSQNNVIPDDALYIIGQIAGSIAIMVSETNKPVTENKLHEIEQRILVHTQGQVCDALDTIRLRHGLIKKN